MRLSSSVWTVQKEEKITCKKLWVTWTVLYGVVGMGLIAQNMGKSMQNRPKLLVRVLNLWGLACSIRVVGGLILATKSDEHLHPILMELLWHSVWLCGCFALTYFILALLDGVGSRYRTSIKEKIVRVSILNTIWVFVFVTISIIDGLKQNWPSNSEYQWFAWMCCAIYLFSGTYCVIGKLNKM
mmetsp:Transcript_29687/g.41378  ORF Transcript_29687/g.41378 Transcript_29687/m.41378 type:complete len:184 (+) Transcript_29687:112-663(+)